MDGRLVTLSNIVQEISRKELFTSPTQPYSYQGEKIEEIVYKLVDGSLKTLWIYSIGYHKGYLFEIFDNKEEALKVLLHEVAR